MGLAGLELLLAVVIEHTALDCLLKDRYSRVEAVIEPAAEVSRARVYFKRADQDDFHAVDMTLQRGRFEARLPRPKDDGDVVYFLEAVEQDGTMRRTPQMTAKVVKRDRDCESGGRMAEEVEGPEVRVLAPSGRGKPEGFSGISRTAPLDETATVSARPRVGPSAAPPPAPAPALAPPPARAPAPRPAGESQTGDYRTGPGDVLRIIVYGNDDLTQVVTVQTDGTFTFPLIGRVVASNVTLKDLQRSITTALGKGFVRNPQVTVVVQEFHSQSVFVVGEVARPGTYALEGETTVVEIMAKAGPTSNAGHEVVIVRPRTAVDRPVLPTEVDAAGETAEVIRVNVREIRMGKLDQNVVLHPRDTVFVSEAAKVFVSGEVRSGGAYTYNPGMTVRQAISMAGGFTPEASSGRIRVVRDVGGKMREVKIKLDEPVEPGDTIVVKSKLF